MKRNMVRVDGLDGDLNQKKQWGLLNLVVIVLLSFVTVASILFGGVRAHADETYSPVSAANLAYRTNFQSGEEMTANNIVQFKLSFDAPGNSQQRVHAGDTFTINLDNGSILDPLSITKDLSSTTTSSSLNDDFSMTTNGGTITVTAKADLPNIQQLSIVIAGTIQPNLNLDKQRVNVTTSFTPAGESKISFPDSYLLVTSNKDDGGGGNTPFDIPDQLSHAIFGGFGGLTLGNDNESHYRDNYVGREEATGTTPSQLYYQHTQDAVSAFGMIKLPKQSAMPKELTWTIEPTDGHSIDFDTVVPWVDSYNRDGGYNGAEYAQMTKGTYTLSQTPDKKGIIFTCSTAGIHPGWSVDLTFYAPTTPRVTDYNSPLYKTTGAADTIQMQTSLKYVDQNDAEQNAGSHLVQMRYMNPDQTGYTPTLDLTPEKTVDLSKSLDPDFDFVLGTVTSPEFIKQFVAAASDPANPQINGGKIAPGYTFTAKYIGDEFGPAHPKDGTYKLAITAKNAQGNEATKETTFVVKNSNVVPLPKSAANIVLHYVDVNDPANTVRTIEIPGYNHNAGDPIEQVAPTEDGLNLQLWINENLPAGYHTAAANELRTGQIQAVLPTTWPAKQATLKYYIIKNGAVPDNGGGNLPVTPSTPTTPTTPTTPDSSTTKATTSTTTTTSPSKPSGLAKRNEAVYAVKKIYLYQNANFTKKARLASYTSKPRVYRPMFVVTGYAYAKNGTVRYKVRDVNHLTKNKNKRGYITTNWQYVRPVYYQSKHTTLTVINPRGVNAYKNANLTNKVRNYKQGTILHVTKFVHHNLTTRYVLSNGQYITGNRKLIKMGKQKLPRYVKAKKAINRYQTVNLKNKNGQFKKGTKIKVKAVDYSQANSVSKHGTLRYYVAGGYITGNVKDVKAFY